MKVRINSRPLPRFVLALLAKEGALKIREVVLNHTEGYDSAEFKHGPNTILGKNTSFSLSDLERLGRAL